MTEAQQRLWLERILVHLRLIDRWRFTQMRITGALNEGPMSFNWMVRDVRDVCRRVPHLVPAQLLEDVE